MGLGQLNYGGSVYPITQNTVNGASAAEEGRRQGQAYTKRRAEDIFNNSIAGIPQKQSFLSRMMQGKQPETIQNSPLWAATGPGALNTSNTGFYGKAFDEFDTKSNKPEMQANMLNRVTSNPLHSSAIRRELTSMIADKLPTAMQDQQRIDSYDMLERMQRDAQKMWNNPGDDWEEELSKKIQNDPKAKQWWSNYIEPYMDEESIPEIAKRIKNKMGGAVGAGATKEDKVMHMTKGHAKKYVTQLPGMDQGGRADDAMKQLDTIIASAEKKGWKFTKKGNNLILNHPDAIDLVLRYDPDNLSWTSDQWGTQTYSDIIRYMGAKLRDPLDHYGFKK